MEEKFKKIDEFMVAIGLSVTDVVRSEWSRIFKRKETADVEEKLKKLDAFIAIEGLDKEKVFDYIFNVDAKNTFVEHKKAMEEMISQKRADSQNLVKCFPADDIRSKVLLFDYAFEGGKFASTSDAYPNCLGIVGWINPDPNAPEGDRLYVLLLEIRYFPYVDGYYLAEENYLSDGYDTMKFIDCSKSFMLERSFKEVRHKYDRHVLDQRCEILNKALNRISSNGECIGELVSVAFITNFYCACDMYHGIALQHGTIRCFLNY